jgi:hypothetical protein
MSIKEKKGGRGKMSNPMFRGSDLRTAFTELEKRYTTQQKSSLFTSYLFAPDRAKSSTTLNLADIIADFDHVMIVIDVPPTTTVDTTGNFLAVDWKVGTTTSINHSVNFNKKYRLVIDVETTTTKVEGPTIIWFRKLLEAFEITPVVSSDSLTYPNVHRQGVTQIVRHFMQATTTLNVTSVSVISLEPRDPFARIGWCASYTKHPTLVNGLMYGQSTAFTVLSVGAPTYPQTFCGDSVKFDQTTYNRQTIDTFTPPVASFFDYNVQIRPLPSTPPSYLMETSQPTVYLFFNPAMVTIDLSAPTPLTIIPMAKAVNNINILSPQKANNTCTMHYYPGPTITALLIGVIIVLVMIVGFSHAMYRQRD